MANLYDITGNRPAGTILDEINYNFTQGVKTYGLIDQTTFDAAPTENYIANIDNTVTSGVPDDIAGNYILSVFYNNTVNQAIRVAYRDTALLVFYQFFNGVTWGTWSSSLYDNFNDLQTQVAYLNQHIDSLTSAAMETKLLTTYATQSPGADSALYANPFMSQVDLETLSWVEGSEEGLKVSNEYQTAIDDSTNHGNSSKDVCAVIHSQHNQKITSVSYYYTSTSSTTVTIKLWRCTKNETSGAVTPVELLATTSRTSNTSAFQPVTVAWDLVCDEWYAIEFYSTDAYIGYYGSASQADGILHAYPVYGANALVQDTEYTWGTSFYCPCQITFAINTQTSGYVVSEEIEMAQLPLNVVAYVETSELSGGIFEINGVVATIDSTAAITCVNGKSGYRLFLIAEVPTTTKLNFTITLTNTTIRIYGLCVFYY